MLLRALLRHAVIGERAFSVVEVPSPEAEDDRLTGRELETLKGERTRHRNRIQGWLRSEGLSKPPAWDERFLEWIETVRTPLDEPLRPRRRAALRNEWQRLRLVEQQRDALEHEWAERLRAVRDHPDDTDVMAARALLLMHLGGIGRRSARLFVLELFGWRTFANRKQLGRFVGLTPSPWMSGNLRRDLGISKAGNRRVRAMLIQISWGWLRHQPDSALTRWYQHKFGGDTKRGRRVGIVALARRLLIDLWRYLEQGVIPEGARLKDAVVL